MTDPWWRVRVTQKMYDGIANLQLLYNKKNHSFPDGPSSPSDKPCRTDRRGPRHQLEVESDAPRYLPRVDTHATKRGSSSDVPSRRGGSTNVPRGRIDCRAHPPKDVEEEETRSQMGLQSLSESMYQLEPAGHELRHDLEYDRNRRLDLQDLVKHLSSDRQKDQTRFAFSLLENERAQRSLRNELSEVRQDISSLRREIYDLQARADAQHREHKNILEMLERKGLLFRKKPRNVDTA